MQEGSCQHSESLQMFRQGSLKYKYIFIIYEVILCISTSLISVNNEPCVVAPSAETFVFQTGEVQQLLNLGGTIPIVYNQETYNIPIKVSCHESC